MPQIETLDLYGRNVPPEQRLWQAVLWQLLEDKINQNKFLISCNKEIDTSLTSTFAMICSFAGYDPTHMKKKLLKKIDEMDSVRKLKKKGIIWNT
jgi:hypothetical protein